MTTKVAVVTGSNKGIGFAIVKGLCKQFTGDVYLTARDETRGKEAVAKLEKEGFEPLFHQLDINDAESAKKFASFIKEKYGGLDILVNNAGIAYQQASTATFPEQAEVTMQTNYHATLGLCQVMFPLLRNGARVVHVSSMLSVMALDKCSTPLVEKLKAVTTIDQVTQYMQKFVDDAKADKHVEEGWAQTAYGMSKVGVTLMTPLQQKELDPQSRKDIVVNSCCPGYVATDMTSFGGHKTTEEGADTPLYLALLPPKTEIRGKFVSERKVHKIQ